MHPNAGTVLSIKQWNQHETVFNVAARMKTTYFVFEKKYGKG